MLRKLIKFARQKIEQNNHRPRKLYSERSLISKIIMVILYIYMASFALLLLFGTILTFSVIFRADVVTAEIIRLSLLLWLAFFAAFVVFFLQFVFAKFFDLSFWDFLKYDIIKSLGLIVAAICGAAVGGEYMAYAWVTIYHLVMSCYVYPTKFLRVYSDYNSKNS